MYSRYKPSGNGSRALEKTLNNLQSKHELNCGTNISTLFEKDSHLKTKVVTVDRRLSCTEKIEWQYYHCVDEIGGWEHDLGICAFCGHDLTVSQMNQLKTLIAKGDRVLPNCGQKTCLQMNPKANFGNGWTVLKNESANNMTIY